MMEEKKIQMFILPLTGMLHMVSLALGAVIFAFCNLARIEALSQMWKTQMSECLKNVRVSFVLSFNA